MKKLTDFYINHDKFQDLSNKAIDWTIKSWKFRHNSPEWKVCKLKREIFMRDALEYLDKAGRELSK